MKKIIITILCLLLVSLLLSPGASAVSEQNAERHSILDGAVEHEGNYYMYVDLHLTWEQAQTFCEGVGGHLVTVTSEEENAVCTQLWRSSTNGFCWLGATDAELEGDWKWITGETWTYEDFCDGDPNGGIAHNYLILYADGQNGYWADEPNQSIPFICEWEAADVESVREAYGYLTSASVIFRDSLYYNGHVYKVFTHDMDYAAAMEYCEKLGCRLADITSAEENAAVLSYLLTMDIGSWCLMGGTDMETEGIWAWDNGQFSYSNWHESEPNGGEYENHVAMLTEDGQWVDCSWSPVFLCEWDNICIANGTVSSDHEYTSETVLTPATCTSPGRVQKTCGTCGHVVEEDVPPLTHVLGDWATVEAPTCNLEGRRERACTLCGLKEDELLPILSHEYGDWAVVSGSKLIPPIVKEKACALCGDTQTERDWSFVWIPIVAVVVLMGIAIGVVNYFRAFRKK